jgi:hypothetical protein
MQGVGARVVLVRRWDSLGASAAQQRVRMVGMEGMQRQGLAHQRQHQEEEGRVDSQCSTVQQEKQQGLRQRQEQ